MPEDLFLARLFLIGGMTLAAIGVALWLALPIASTLPPFVLTPVLALVYGTFCWRRSRRSPRPA